MSKHDCPDCQCRPDVSRTEVCIEPYTTTTATTAAPVYWAKCGHAHPWGVPCGMPVDVLRFGNAVAGAHR